MSAHEPAASNTLLWVCNLQEDVFPVAVQDKINQVDVKYLLGYLYLSLLRIIILILHHPKSGVVKKTFDIWHTDIGESLFTKSHVFT